MPFNYIKDGDIYKYLVGGKWQFSSSKKTIDVFNPATEKSIGKLQCITTQEIDEMLKQAKLSQKKWKEFNLNQRAEILCKAADLIIKNADFLADLLSKEIAKAKHICIHEVMRTADLIRSTSEEALRMNGEVLDGNSYYHSNKKKKALVEREPLGVVLAISPFNYPINLSFSKVAPALISGNSIVLKPSTQGAISVIHVTELFLEAGVPPGVLSLVTGKSSEIGDYLTSHRDIDMLAFTGSTQVGKHLASISGMKPLLLELGGKDGAIILEDCDLDLAVRETVQGTFSYSGQRCTAVKRIIIIDSLADKFIRRFVEETRKLKVGMPNEDAVICPLINKDACNYVQDLILDAKKNGAKVLLEG